MGLRHVVGGMLVILVVPASAGAARPDGLDCDQHSEIPSERCAEWKERNPNGRWWCRWNLAKGTLGAIYGSQSPPISPGLDLTRITRESARSHTATKELLEAYARQHIRHNESLFGFKPNGYDLELVDFQRRSPGVRRTAQEDGTVLEEILPAVSTIHLRQVIKQRALDDATIQLQVDDENRLLSMFSSFLVDPPPSIPNHSVTIDQALQTALQDVAQGYELTDDDLVSAVETFTIVAGSVRPTIRVFLSIDDPLVDVAILEKQVVIDGTTGAMLESFDAYDAHEVPEHQAIPSRLFRDSPPNAGGTTPAGFVAALD